MEKFYGRKKKKLFFFKQLNLSNFFFIYAQIQKKKYEN